jgi:O-antigen/teichoic acid export membrane protein
VSQRIDVVEHLPADPSTLDRSLVSGMAWTAVLRWSAQIVSWVATFYAVHLLAPSDYGLVAMATLAIGLARMVEDFGPDAILVHDCAITGNSQVRLAGLQLMLGLALTALFPLLSFPIAMFFNEPKLQMVIVLLGAVFIRGVPTRPRSPSPPASPTTCCAS